MISSRRVRSGHLFSLGTIPSSEQQEMVAKAKAAKVKHHSVGVYKCGDFVSHCVPDFELEEHIARVFPGFLFRVDRYIHESHRIRLPEENWTYDDIKNFTASRLKTI